MPIKTALFAVVLMTMFGSGGHAIGSGIDIGMIAKSIDYEAGHGADRIKETAKVPQVYISVQQHAVEQPYARLYLEATPGTVDADFKGPTWDGKMINTETDYGYGHYEVDLGYTKAIGGGFSCTPFLGIGYRAWSRDIRDVTSSTYVQDNEYDYLFFPFGLSLAWSTEHFWTELCGVFRYGDGNYRIETYGGADEVDLGRSYGYSITGEVGYVPGSKWAFFLAGSFGNQKFSESDDYRYYYAKNEYVIRNEPSGREIEAGIQFSIRRVW